VIEYFSGKIPMLGVCLGFQAMAQAFGGKIIGPAMLTTTSQRLFRGDCTPKRRSYAL
jgi:anthranilate/para-aminobenzoate synthase component II